MSTFTHALIVEHRLDGYFENQRFFSYQLLFGSDYPAVLVEPGERSNLASVPWFLQWLVPKTGKYDQAAFIHDKLYERHALNYGRSWVAVNRKYADQIFYVSMGVLGVAKWRRVAMYYAVRAAGKKYWNKTTRAVPYMMSATTYPLPVLDTP